MMDYPNKTFTNAGADLMAADDANSQATVVDKMIVSQSLPDESGEPLDEVTVDDFDNPMKFQIDNYKHQSSTFQVEAVLNNKGLQDDYPINMVGLLAHSQNANNDNETLLAVATADEPFILPKETNTPFNFRIGMALTYKNSNNITAVLSDAGTVDVQDLRKFKQDENELLHTAMGATVDQAAASYANDHRALQELSNNYSDFMSSANSAITSGSTANQSMIVKDSKVTRKALNATINQTGAGLINDSEKIHQISVNQQTFSSSATSYLTSAVSSNNSYTKSASSVNNKILYAVLNQNNADSLMYQKKLSTLSNNQQELSSSTSTTISNNSNHAESLNNLNKRVAIAALNEAAADNYLLRTKILGKE